MIGNLLSVLYLSVFLWAGCGLARKTVPTAGGALLLPLSCSYGLVLLAALPALFALFFGFALPAVLLGGAAALAAGAWAWLRRPPKAARDKDLIPMLACVLPLFILGIWLLHTHTLYWKGGAYWCGQSTYGDLPIHLAFIKSIAVQGQFPPAYPLLSGQALFGYPFLCETVSSVFVVLGSGLKTAALLPCLPALFAVFGMGWQLARLLLGRAGKACLAYWLFFMGSGFGFAYFLGGGTANFSRIFTAYYETPTNYVEENIKWVNPLADLLVPQRATLFGWALGFACLYLLYRFTFEQEWRLWPWLCLAAAPLPLVQTHAALALVLLSAVCLLRTVLYGPRTIKSLAPWLGYAAVSGLLWLPQLLGIIFRQTSTGQHFLQWHFNWANEGDPYFWFYIKNIGIVYLLLLPAFLWAGKKLRWAYAGGVLILLVSEIMLFQPNPYDNNKLLFFWHLLGCILVAGFCWDMLALIPKKSVRGLLGAGLVFLGTFGSVLTLGREVASQYQQFDSDAIQAAAYVDEHAAPDALFLTGTQHLNPVSSLAGRDILCGASLYLYYHGMDYSAQEAAVRQLYEQPTHELLAEWGIDYAVFSPAERASYAVNESFYKSNFPIWYAGGGYTIYQIT